MAVTKNRYLYYVSMKPMTDPRLLADLKVDFSDPMAGLDEKGDDEDDDDAKAGDTDEADRIRMNNASYSVRDIKWSPCGRRIAVLYDEKIRNRTGTEMANFVSLWAYDFSTPYRIGFIIHPQGNVPLDVTFRRHFDAGALMAIMWDNGHITQHHLCFNLNKSY